MGGVLSTLTSNFDWKMGVAVAVVLGSIRVYQNRSVAISPDAAPAGGGAQKADTTPSTSVMRVFLKCYCARGHTKQITHGSYELV